MRIYDHETFTVDRLREAKGSTTVTVALPAKDEATTIEAIITTIRDGLMGSVGLVDELIVIDDHSTDDTAAVARQAGADVYPAGEILPRYGAGHGKGEALWKSLHVSTGDIVCWCDADIRNYDNRFILGPLGPLLTEPDIGFTKGFYRRPLRDDGEGGGRVTELVARPLISSLFPHLGPLVQPLSGEFAGRRAVLEQVPFSRGYAVDLALLIDLTERFGADSIAQVDLGTRIHRNRPLRELGPQSAAITNMVLRRAGHATVTEIVEGIGDLTLLRPTLGDATITVGDLPPMVEVDTA
ncbi:MAG: glucosyl-3-phosphoglycerate synthase [Acidimicrobiales bacterium]